MLIHDTASFTVCSECALTIIRVSGMIGILHLSTFSWLCNPYSVNTKIITAMRITARAVTSTKVC